MQVSYPHGSADRARAVIPGAADMPQTDLTEEIVQLYAEVEQSLQNAAAAGQRPQTAVDKMKVARLEAEIDLLREQLD
ncbi:MAG: hypothetical protein JW993_20715 [Sedimentisphaerales bacterium]|nr:hypothetical protein [Sedimentisphaerales bacterium]